MSERVIEGFSHQFPGEEVSWAGRCPWTGELCFGTEDGHLFFLPAGGDVPPDSLPGLEVLADPINGVAFAGDLVGISSRAEVVIGRRRSDGGLDWHKPFVSGGAHGIAPMSSGGFIAPLGIDGLLFMSLEKGKLDVKVGKIEGESPNFYRLTPLGCGEDGEVFACAARNSRLLAITVKDGLVKTPITGHQFAGIDLVDVCSLKSPSAPLAAAALNLDGSLLLTKNILENQEPLALSFDDLDGTAYSVLSAQGHIFVLTSVELVVFPNLAADFLVGKPMDRELDVSVMPMRAIEAFLVDDEAVLTIEGDKAVSHKVADMVEGVNAPPVGVVGAARRGLVVSHPAYTISVMPTIPHQRWRTTQSKIVLAPAA
jgi:hypothetical protein